MRLHKYDPLAVRRDLWKTVAHSILRRTGDRLRRATLAAVKRNAIEVVLDRHLGGIVCVCSHLSIGRVRVFGRRAHKYQVLAVGTPHGACLHQFRIVSAWQRLQLFCFAVIPGQDSARRVEDLQEPVIEEVGHVVEIRALRSRRLDRGHHMPAVRRNLRHESQSQLRIHFAAE